MKNTAKAAVVDLAVMALNPATTDGRIILMNNKRVRVQYGRPGKTGAIQKTD